MLRAAGAAADAVDVLVALRGVLGEVDACGWKEGRVDVRKKEEGGTNWFSMAIFGINYPMSDNLWMESGGQERLRRVQGTYIHTCGKNVKIHSKSQP